MDINSNEKEVEPLDEQWIAEINEPEPKHCPIPTDIHFWNMRDVNTCER